MKHNQPPTLGVLDSCLCPTAFWFVSLLSLELWSPGQFQSGRFLKCQSVWMFFLCVSVQKMQQTCVLGCAGQIVKLVTTSMFFLWHCCNQACWCRRLLRFFSSLHCFNLDHCGSEVRCLFCGFCLSQLFCDPSEPCVVRKGFL